MPTSGCWPPRPTSPDWPCSGSAQPPKDGRWPPEQGRPGPSTGTAPRSKARPTPGDQHNRWPPRADPGQSAGGEISQASSPSRISLFDTSHLGHGERTEHPAAVFRDGATADRGQPRHEEGDRSAVRCETGPATAAKLTVDNTGPAQPAMPVLAATTLQVVIGSVGSAGLAGSVNS